MLGFKSAKTAYATLKGSEVMRMIRKLQCILLGPGVSAEVRFFNKTVWNLCAMACTGRLQQSRECLCRVSLTGAVRIRQVGLGRWHEVGSLSSNTHVGYHIRYGGYGGIGYYLVSDNYIALMNRFTTCGSWEGRYILDFLQENESDVQPDTIHADTQGQSTAIFGLAIYSASS